jgi:hypothetical protein
MVSESGRLCGKAREYNNKQWTDTRENPEKLNFRFIKETKEC